MVIYKIWTKRTMGVKLLIITLVTALCGTLSFTLHYPVWNMFFVWTLIILAGTAVRFVISTAARKGASHVQLLFFHLADDPRRAHQIHKDSNVLIGGTAAPAVEYHACAHRAGGVGHYPYDRNVPQHGRKRGKLNSGCHAHYAESVFALRQYVLYLRAGLVQHLGLYPKEDHPALRGYLHCVRSRASEGLRKLIHLEGVMVRRINRAAGNR